MPCDWYRGLVPAGAEVASDGLILLGGAMMKEAASPAATKSATLSYLEARGAKLELHWHTAPQYASWVPARLAWRAAKTS